MYSHYQNHSFHFLLRVYFHEVLRYSLKSLNPTYPDVGSYAHTPIWSSNSPSLTASQVTAEHAHSQLQLHAEACPCQRGLGSLEGRLGGLHRRAYEWFTAGPIGGYGKCGCSVVGGSES